MLTSSYSLRRLTAVVSFAAACVVGVGTSDSWSGFTTASLANTTNSSGSAMLAVSHAYGNSCNGALTATGTAATCPATVFPASSTTAGATRSDTITNTGTTSASATTNTYRVAGCGPVALNNTGSSQSAGAMLGRTGTTFSPATGPFTGAGSITLDGTGYASAVTARQEANGPTSGTGTLRYGYGIWFKTTSTTFGPLFALTAAANDSVTGTNDRIAYLTATGQIAFVPTSGATVTSNTSGLNNGSWHFTYVTVTGTRSLVGSISNTVTVTVDGVTAIPTTTVTLARTTGYWHAGWAPISGTGRYFTGSLSGLTLDTDGTISAPTGIPTGYTPGNELWELDDSGGSYDGTTADGVLTTTAIFGGTYDVCTFVTVTWPLLAVTSTTLRALVTAGAKSAAFPAPAASTSTQVTLTTAAGTATVLKGLLLYAPLRADYKVGTAWTLPLLWSSAAPAGAIVLA